MSLVFISFVLCFQPAATASAEEAEGIETPESHFGFMPGADGMLFDYGELIEYMEKLDEASPRLKLVEIGESPMGKPMYIAFISDQANIERLDELKEINRSLAVDPDLDERERARLISEGRVFFLATLSMHSGEVGPSQASPLIAYDLVTTGDPLKLGWLSDVVYMMVPCHNPDGMDMVVEHYRKYKGTKYEGSRMPFVYHKYVGHDNNRDFVILSQKDTKAIARIYNLDWFPQVMVEKHQMGSAGVRYFVPPNHDPIAENVDASVWNWTGIFGSNMMKDMTGEGLAGIAQHYLFDDYWPGSTETCIWKNVIGFLTEAASVQYARPIFVEENELGVYGKGLSEYKKSINMPKPWKGGWWRLSDIIALEISSTMSIMKTASLHRGDILTFRNDICREEVSRGRSEPPYYYVMPSSPDRQHDPSELSRMVRLLEEHGVSVYRLTRDDVYHDGYRFSEGDIVVPLAQPFRAFIKEVMEAQEFPLRHYTPGGEIVRPYDITSWSLPLHSGVKAIEVDERNPKLENALERLKGPVYTVSKENFGGAFGAAFDVRCNSSFHAAFAALGMGLNVYRLDEAADMEGRRLPAGSFVVTGITERRELFERLLGMAEVEPVPLEDRAECERICRKDLILEMPRIALVETNFHDMDAGWTRFVFDSYDLPFEVVRPGDFEKTDFRGKYDVVVFPDNDKSILMKGKYEDENRYYSSSYPPEYVSGIGEKGIEKLMSFLDGGGRIISWGRSVGLFINGLKIKRGKEETEEFDLPVRDLSDGLVKDGLYCPGSLVRISLLEGHPLTMGMQGGAGVFFRGRPVFRTSLPRFDMDRRVIAKFPEKDILLSGYAEKIESVSDRTAMVWLRKGNGQLVLFAFGPQFRASTAGSYKLLFNSILLPGVQ